MSEFKSSDQRLTEAACGRHRNTPGGPTDYQLNCYLCVRNYFQRLIDETYTPNRVHEALVRENNMHKAQAASYRVEAQHLRDEAAYLRSGGRGIL